VAQFPKILDPFTCALAPPFIGRRRDFYIPKTPSSSRNIPNVNTYKNVFFIPYIYKHATSSHSKSGLCFSLVREFPSARLPTQTSDRFPNQPSSEVRDFAGSRFQTFACSRLRDFADSRFPKIACSRT
jgi:hypothetical protein